MPVEPVLDGNHHQAVVVSDLFQVILQVKPVAKYRKQQDHCRFVRCFQDLLHHRFIAPVMSRFLPVVHRKLDDHHVRQPVRVLFRHPADNLPVIPHIAEGRRCAAHAGIHQMHVRPAVYAVCFTEPGAEPDRPALLINSCPGAFRDGPADRCQRDLFPAACPVDHFFQPCVVARAHDRILQSLQIPFLLKHRLFSLSPCRAAAKQHQCCQCRSQFPDLHDIPAPLRFFRISVIIG